MNINEMFVQDASRIQGDVYNIMRVRGRVSALIRKDVLPEGMGFNFQTPVTQRSSRTGGSGWVEVQAEDNLPLDQGNYVKLSFKDQGNGISKEDLKKYSTPILLLK